jgi:hypothetical protein
MTDVDHPTDKPDEPTGGYLQLEPSPQVEMGLSGDKGPPTLHHHRRDQTRRRRPEVAPLQRRCSGPT